MLEEHLVHQFTDGRFEVRIYLAKPVEDMFAGHVALLHGGSIMCRIVLVKPAYQAGAIEALEQRARDWINGWNERQRSLDCGAPGAAEASGG